MISAWQKDIISSNSIVHRRHIIYLCFEYNGLALLQQSRAGLGSAEASSFIESMI